MDLEAHEPATKGDLNAAVRLLRCDLRSEIAGVRNELKEEIAGARTGLRTELKAEVAGLRNELKGEIAETRKTLALEIIKTNHRMEKMEERMMGEFHGLKAYVASAMDKVIGHIEDFRRETAIWPQVMGAQGKTLRGHERRIRRIENR